MTSTIPHTASDHFPHHDTRGIAPPLETVHTRMNAAPVSSASKTCPTAVSTKSVRVLQEVKLFRPITGYNYHAKCHRPSKAEPRGPALECFETVRQDPSPSLSLHLHPALVQRLAPPPDFLCLWLATQRASSLFAAGYPRSGFRVTFIRWRVVGSS
ncbi:hypothetical protein PM082_012449 [Marasmius tenuissimus]|nr:hypothetical protein PM082_012449 [Marasmius tenuissimus]